MLDKQLINPGDSMSGEQGFLKAKGKRKEKIIKEVFEENVGHEFLD